MDSVVAQLIKDNFRRRLAYLHDPLASIEGMRSMPDEGEVRIGNARKTRGVILFADIKNSTRLAVKYADAPEKMLFTLNLVVPTLMDVAHYYRGEFEKNTGDGILAYFGVGTITDEDAVAQGLYAAIDMMEAMRDPVNPELQANGLDPVQITVGADLGDFLVAHIGLQRRESPFVAVGPVANRAAKIQASAIRNEIRVGEDFYKSLWNESRKLFRLVVIPGPWPFQVRKTRQEIEFEQRAVQQIPTAYRAPGSFLFPSLPQIIGQSYTPMIDPKRPYRVYAMKQRW